MAQSFQQRKQMDGLSWWQRLSRFVLSGEVLVPLSFLLIGLSLCGVISIYGPVLLVEVSYQVKVMAAETGFLSEDGSFRLIPGFQMGVGKAASYPAFGLVIPKLFIDEQIVPNVDPNDKQVYLKALEQGIAHAAGTSLPGQEGLGYFFAHSSGYSATRPQQRAVFYLLGKLKQGDEITLFYQNNTYTYQVKRTEVVSANDLSFLKAGEQEGEMMVLQTCWPIGTSLKRLLVFASRVS